MFDSAMETAVFFETACTWVDIRGAVRDVFEHYSVSLAPPLVVFESTDCISGTSSMPISKPLEQPNGYG